MKNYLILLWATCISGFISAQEIAVLPKPTHMVVNNESFEFGKQANVKIAAYQGDSIKAIFNDSFKNNFCKATGIKISSTNNANKASIVLELNRKLGSEAYKLEVSKDKIRIEAARPAGFFYALQTLKQLMPRNVMAGVAATGTKVWSIPSVVIEDSPQFGWRGFMLDEGRHFFGKEQVKKVLDMMATYKMNRFHWHLSEDQGWRIEIKK